MNKEVSLRTDTPAILAKAARKPAPSDGLRTLTELCADLDLSPERVRARVSVAELVDIAAGNTTPGLLDRFSTAAGRELTRRRRHDR